MLSRLIKFIFFGNYFVGFLAVALSVETCVQLRLPFNSIPYYLLLFCATVMYYTYAYTGVLQSSSGTNLRSEWYRQNQKLVWYTQWFLLLLCTLLGVFIVLNYAANIMELPLSYWAIILVLLLSSVLYYGLLPKAIFKLNLRNTGWLKAFVIGFVWAGCVSLIPIVVLRLEQTPHLADPVLITGLFIKNWMFCTINAIMFDIKDYADDSNQQLKTFVVSFGLHRTISYVLIPLSLIGIAAMLGFTHYRHFSMLPVLINLIPFLLLILVSYSMYREKSILYYLVVIDGLVLIKALCGILAMQFVNS
jgi:hypothetical protein